MLLRRNLRKKRLLTLKVFVFHECYRLLIQTLIGSYKILIKNGVHSFLAGSSVQKGKLGEKVCWYAFGSGI